MAWSTMCVLHDPDEQTTGLVGDAQRQLIHGLLSDQMCSFFPSKTQAKSPREWWAWELKGADASPPPLPESTVKSNQTQAAAEGGRSTEQTDRHEAGRPSLPGPPAGLVSS